MKRHLKFGKSPMPIDYKQCVSDIEVQHPAYRTEDRARFASADSHALELVLEACNPHDSNAIRVYGHCLFGKKSERLFLGYLPREVSLRLAENGWADSAVPQLREIWWGGYSRDWVSIRMSIVVPKKNADPTNLAKNLVLTKVDVSQPMDSNFDESSLKMWPEHDFNPLASLLSGMCSIFLYFGGFFSLLTNLSRVLLESLGLFFRLIFSWFGHFFGELSQDILDNDQRQPSALSLISRLFSVILVAGILLVLLIKLAR
jgi:hypothetical protein